jgi:HD-GYP domain-containing protein (c-di-GMP phosphodiesterase class II)
VLPVIGEITENAVFPLLLSLEARDDYLYRHPFSVAAISSLMGKWMGLPDNEQAILTIGALLHNAGKMWLPDVMWLKNGPLDDDEFKLMKSTPLSATRCSSGP